MTKTIENLGLAEEDANAHFTRVTLAPDTQLSREQTRVTHLTGLTLPLTCQAFEANVCYCFIFSCATCYCDDVTRCAARLCEGNFKRGE